MSSMSDSIGFLSVKRHAEHGYFGGYLIVNPLARPLEFHCTMPVRPTRAQELLYGSTLDDFLCGEQIAAAMVGKAKLKPEWLFTDCRAVLALTGAVAGHVLYVDLPAESTTGAAWMPPAGKLPSRTLTVESYRFEVLPECRITENELAERLQGLAPYFDLAEPFQRITEALLEAHPIARAA
ncbi:MAG: hypothetical protein D6753_03790 [Planctomycetota bacterium]|nr:MAG: hypothetical protein D6753_03790 [Planctomycetota bacterium]